MSQVEIKILQLRKTESKSAKTKWVYDVVEGDKVIATRHSNREYVACFVEWNGLNYFIAFMFGRLELIGKRESGKMTYPYALALVNMEDKDHVPNLTPFVKIKTDKGDITIMGIDPNKL